MIDSTDALENLLARITLNDQTALEQLYSSVAPKLNGIAMKIVNDTDLANDVLQETFLQIWDNAGDYRRDQSEPMTWMTSLLRYRALDKLRSENREKIGVTNSKKHKVYSVSKSLRHPWQVCCKKTLTFV